MESFVQALARLRKEQSLSLRELGSRAAYSYAVISQVENGLRLSTRRFAEAMDSALGAGGDLVAAHEADRFVLPGLPIDGLAHGEEGAERVAYSLDKTADGVALGWLERCLAEHRRAEDVVGARPLLRVVRAQFDVLKSMLRTTASPRAVSLAAQYAQFLGWMSNDTRQPAAARAWWERSHHWAREAGEWTLVANTLVMRAHAAWGANDPSSCLALVEAAAALDPQVSTGMQGMTAQMAARAYAIAGEPASARYELDRAHVLIEAAAEAPEDEPAWMYYYDGSWFGLQRGMIEHVLGEPGRAVELFETGLKQIRESYPRDAVWYHACLAHAHVDAGQVEGAVETALNAAPVARSINAHAWQALGHVRDRLRMVGSDAQARELDEALR